MGYFGSLWGTFTSLRGTVKIGHEADDSWGILAKFREVPHLLTDGKISSVQQRTRSDEAVMCCHLLISAQRLGDASRPISTATSVNRYIVSDETLEGRLPSDFKLIVIHELTGNP